MGRKVGLEAGRGTLDYWLARIDKGRLPRHVAIIMDGNGRWARRRMLPRVAGHRVGMDSVHDIVETAANLGIEVLTLFAFSTENWKRPRTEVESLMRLLVEYLGKELRSMLENNIRFQAIGRLEELPEWVQAELVKTIAQTKNNTGMLLNVALNYSGKAEIVDAAKRIAAAALAGELSPEKLDEATFASYLYTAGLPEPDLLIRTSGELRISNFLLWQLAYAELWITKTLWPDFRGPEFLKAVYEYQLRERRFGDIGGASSSKKKEAVDGGK